MLGVPIGTVRVCPYTLEWDLLFQEEATRIRSAIGAHILDTQHIGSTSVPGLAAKPIIDIGIAVASFEDATCCIQPLVALGYRYLGENGIPRRHFFIRDDPRTHNVHMNEHTSADWGQTIRFRDYLRAHPEVVSAYADLKIRLAQRFPTEPPDYHAGKDAFIKQVIQAALADAQELPSSPPST